MRRFWIFPPRVGEMILEDLEMLVRGRDLSQGSKLHHLEGTVYQAGGETLQTGAVVTVWGQEASLPTNPVIFLICNHEFVLLLWQIYL